MRRIKNFWWALAFVAGSFFILTRAYSANTDIIINEIGAYPPRTREWLELWNRGSAAVDLKGWIFWEKFLDTPTGTNHGLSATGTGTTIVAAGEYAAIAEDALDFKTDYPDFVGPIFDSTWSKGLSEEVREIGLKDNKGNFIELFTYLPTTRFSLERKSPYLADYTANNWQEHASAHSLGAVNSVFSSVGQEIGAQSASSSPPEVTSSTVPDNTLTWAGIKINEVMPDPETGEEWIELFNPASTSLELSGGTLCDNRADGECVIASPTSTIPARGWLTIFLPSAKLNNSGDTVILKNQNGSEVDRIKYGPLGAPWPKKGQALARIVDGQDTGEIPDWSITVTPTPGRRNVITAPVTSETAVNSGGSAGGQNSVTPTPATKAIKIATTTDSVIIVSPIVFNEIFPNPEGADTAGEFVEIKNISATNTVSLAGWHLETAGGQKFAIASTTLAPEGIAAWRRMNGLFALKNTSDTVRLFNEQGQLVAQLHYDNAPEGQSYNRLPTDRWEWSTHATLGTENNVKAADTVKISWQVAAPRYGVAGRELLFSAASSTDPRGGTFFFGWNFGDGPGEDGGVVRHVFARPGTYLVTVFATSTAGTAGQKTRPIVIGMGAAREVSGVVFSEVFPNPAGTDDSEFVEIMNAGTTSTAVGGWSIAQGDKKFVLPDNTSIKPGGFLVFKRLITNLALTNQGGSLRLLDDTEEVRDEVEYPKAKENKSYALGPEGEWAWLEATPGFMADQSLWERSLSAEPATAAKGVKNKNSTAVRAGASSARAISLVTGIVSTLPGTLGSQYFYLSTEQGGVQVFQSKKDFPEVRLGDEVAVRGWLHSVSGLARINIGKSSDIDILDSEKLVVADSISSVRLPMAPNGSLVEIVGELTELKSTHAYVDDSHGEVLVYFKSGTGISSKDLKLGQVVRVTGIVERSNKKEQILPRSINDIEVIPSVTPPTTTAAVGPPSEPYLPVTVGGIATIILGALARSRGMVLKIGAKKVAQLALGILKNNRG